MSSGFAPNIDLLEDMLHSRVRNYIVPGLDSFQVGASGTQEERDAHGAVRLFRCTREHSEQIVPHSHRYDFQCIVLEGRVTNTIWEPVGHNGGADDFAIMEQVAGAGLGQYDYRQCGTGKFRPRSIVYGPGETYEMEATAFHSIQFSRGAYVLFLQGPKKDGNPGILQPIVEDVVIHTFAVQPWMFGRQP